MHIYPRQKLAAAFSIFSRALTKDRTHSGSPWASRASNFLTAYKNALTNDSIALHIAQWNAAIQSLFPALKTAKSCSADDVVVATERVVYASSLVSAPFKWSSTSDFREGNQSHGGHVTLLSAA
jgi:hypothetical protein